MLASISDSTSRSIRMTHASIVLRSQARYLNRHMNSQGIYLWQPSSSVAMCFVFMYNPASVYSEVANLVVIVLLRRISASTSHYIPLTHSFNASQSLERYRTDVFELLQSTMRLHINNRVSTLFHWVKCGSSDALLFAWTASDSGSSAGPTSTTCESTSTSLMCESFRKVRREGKTTDSTVKGRSERGEMGRGAGQEFLRCL